MPKPNYKSKTVFHFKAGKQPYGLYSWSRKNKRMGGLVLRIGPIGHIQAQHYRGRLVGAQREERRGKHGVMLSWWGIRGRRRKKAIEVAIYL